MGSFDLNDAPKTPAKKVATLPAKDERWSEQQRAIFAFIRDEKRNLLVDAVAGSGKTTTILKALEYLPPSGNNLLCAFNRKIMLELEQRNKSSARVKTLHGLGFGLVKRARPHVAVDQYREEKLAQIAAAGLGMPFSRGIGRAVGRLAALGKEMMPYAGAPGNDPEKVLQSPAESLEALGAAFQLYATWPPNMPTIRCADLALEVMRLSVEEDDGTISYADMLYLPLRLALSRGDYDCVIVDECQDMNFAQLELAQRVMREGGRIIVVGDRRQAIYHFRGADANSMDRLKKKFDMAELPLSTSYRCPQAVAFIARRFVPHFNVPENAPQGVVRVATGNDLVRQATAGDFVLSRLNAPLVRTCLEFIGVDKRAKVEGRDLGEALQKFIDRLRPTDLNSLMGNAFEWLEEQKAKHGDDEDRLAEAYDQVEVLKLLTDKSKNLADVHNKIQAMFNDVGESKDTIVCSTVHKAKGLEADRVWILCDTFKGEWMGGTGEENNLKYVAVTRARKELVWVNPRSVKMMGVTDGSK